MLKSAFIDSYFIDAKVLLSDVLNFDESAFILNSNSLVNEDDELKYIGFLNRRLKHEPVKYITNKCEFMGVDFYVDKNVLIPRPETELLVETAYKYIKKYNYKKILEIGTGSGCISISLKHLDNTLDITAIDISENALNIAKKNAETYNQNINFVLSDVYKNLLDKDFDVIISNPPYIKTDVINTLERDVKDFEPKLALDGMADGLYFYKTILENHVLVPNGMVFFEIGYDQNIDIKSLLDHYNFKNIEVLKDYSGCYRIALGAYDQKIGAKKCSNV